MTAISNLTRLTLCTWNWLCIYEWMGFTLKSVTVINWVPVRHHSGDSHRGPGTWNCIAPQLPLKQHRNDALIWLKVWGDKSFSRRKTCFNLQHKQLWHPTLKRARKSVKRSHRTLKSIIRLPLIELGDEQNTLEIIACVTGIGRKGSALSVSHGTHAKESVILLVNSIAINRACEIFARYWLCFHMGSGYWAETSRYFFESSRTRASYFLLYVHFQELGTQ